MRRIFNFSGKSAEPLPLVVTLTAAESAPGYSSRRGMLNQIGEFLLNHDLSVSPGNLTLAHSVFSGSNVNLGRQIMRRQLANEPVTQAWLDKMQGEDREKGGDYNNPDGREELNRLIARLDRSLLQFSSNASEASNTASDYHAALAETATSLEQVAGQQPIGSSAIDIVALTQLTRTMIERTRDVEDEMRRRENEAVALRKNLEHARRDAAIDHLTGLANRRAFEIVLDREYRAARQANDQLCIAFCDIDRFKLINDAHGHDAGDRVIQAIAKVLQRISGENCHLARHGGEEFVLLFRGISPDQACEKLDEARQEFARRKLINRETDIPIGTVTFSGGVADVFAYANPRAALKAADEALYQAKEQGRNRILISSRTAS